MNFLDTTLGGIIQRFEEEFPECRVNAGSKASESSPKSQPGSKDHVSSSVHGENSTSDETETATSLEQSSFLLDSDVGETSDSEPEREVNSELATKNGSLTRHKRRASDMSLASRALAFEEGNLHKLSQHVQRGIMRPQKTNEGAIGRFNVDPNSDNDNDDISISKENNNNNHANSSTNVADYEPPYDSYNDYYVPGPPEVEGIRQKLESLTGEEIRRRVRAQGYEETMRQIGKNAESLRRLEREQELEREWERERLRKNDNGVSAVTATSDGTPDGGSSSIVDGADAGTSKSKSNLSPSLSPEQEEYAKKLRLREAQLAAHVDILKLDDDFESDVKESTGTNDGVEGGDSEVIVSKSEGKRRDIAVEESQMNM